MNNILMLLLIDDIMEEVKKVEENIIINTYN